VDLLKEFAPPRTKKKKKKKKKRGSLIRASVKFLVAKYRQKAKLKFKKVILRYFNRQN